MEHTVYNTLSVFVSRYKGILNVYKCTVFSNNCNFTCEDIFQDSRFFSHVRKKVMEPLALIFFLHNLKDISHRRDKKQKMINKSQVLLMSFYTCCMY